MKTLQYIFAAGLICGATTFTACSDDSSSSDVEEKQQISENHAAFVENTRANIKTLAENLNFASWEYANSLNQNFNEHVLLNPDFTNSILFAAAGDILKTMKEIDKKHELYKLGFRMIFNIDFSKFKYQFKMNEDGTGFEVTDADNFEMILTGYNPETKKIEKEMYKLTLEFDGSIGEAYTKKLEFGSIKLDSVAAIIEIPENVSFEIATKSNKKWSPVFKGKFKNSATTSGDSEYFDFETTSFDVEGQITSMVPYTSGKKTLTDNTTLDFKITQNAKKKKGSIAFSYEHNDKNMLEVSATMTNSNGMLNFDQFTSSNSIFDILTAMMVGNSLESFKITLLDDMVVNVKISDMEKFGKIHSENADARRSYTDKETIEKYASELNKVLTASIESKDTKQKIDVKMEAVKFGVDYWTMPSFKFSDEKNYVPFVDLLDQESIIYGLNIIDHTVEPLSEAIVVVRQLMAYLHLLTGTYDDYQGTALK